jgi:Pvc16 N-terminal domain/Carboxypeptidase regulatory-like domain
MIRDLDDVLKKILDDAEAPNELRAADVSFETPDKQYAPEHATVNLFLHEIKENRELRDPLPIVDRVDGQFVRRQPPLRVDCTYMVTAWSNQTKEVKVAEEHRLLSQALLYLRRRPTIPAKFLANTSLASQPLPLPTMVAEVDPTKNLGEFWSALGTAPRPLFQLVVTLAMDLEVQVPEGPAVVMKEIRIKPMPENGVKEPLAVWFQIGGTVSNSNTLEAIPNALVNLLELERETTTDEQGHFSFSDLAPGSYTLRAAATGFTKADKTIEVPSAAYDVSLTGAA